MAPNQDSPKPIGPANETFSSPLVFIFACLCLTLFTWPIRWLISGAPILTFLILVGDSKGRRVLPDLNIWPIFTTLHFAYAIASTSWLLYWVYAALCYPAIGLVCLFQFDWAANTAREFLRKAVTRLHFIDDKIAFFDIPALEIDSEVDGLLVIRGVTFSLSTLSFVAHGIEVGVKLSDDIELAIQVEEVHVKLFRRIDIGDTFFNIKGGSYEMTFGSLPTPIASDINGETMFSEGTHLLKAALEKGDSRRPEMVKMTSQFTGGNPPGASSPREGWDAMSKMSPEEGNAGKKYRKRLQFISETNAINEARQHILSAQSLSEDDTATLLAAICSALHSTPSVPHPPDLSVKVSTIRNQSNPATKRFIHRFPLLYRLLLNPICYFHPVFCSTITASASGRWIDTLLVSQIFKSYPDQDKEIASLHARISAWLSDANFVVELGGIKGLAQVPVNSSYDQINNLTFDSVLAYRSVPKPGTEFHDLTQVIKLAGADVTVTLPSYLLPRHNHLLPPKPSELDTTLLSQTISNTSDKIDETTARHELKELIKDTAPMKVAAHVRLPCVLNQDLLDFTAVLVKASKIVELEKELEGVNTPSNSNPSSPTLAPVKRASTSTSALVDNDTASLQSFKSEAESEYSLSSEVDSEGNRISKRRSTISNKLKGGFRVGVKRMVVDTVVNERWIARLVGRVMRKLEGAKGEVGYVAEIGLPLEYYRNKGVGELEKILP